MTISLQLQLMINHPLSDVMEAIVNLRIAISIGHDIHQSLIIKFQLINIRDIALKSLDLDKWQIIKFQDNFYMFIKNKQFFFIMTKREY